MLLENYVFSLPQYQLIGIFMDPNLALSINTENIVAKLARKKCQIISSHARHTIHNTHSKIDEAM